MSLQFKLHVIPPPKRLDWSSPRTLLKDTLFHHILQDPFAIGHFYVEFESARPNRFGVKRVLTGMSRQAKNRSTLQVMRQKIGLGTFFHDFKGKLDLAKSAEKRLQWAKDKNRLKTICVNLTPERAEILMHEMSAWIEAGSFRHYGGGHVIARGEGSGCAEFGMHFLSLALGKNAAHPSWIRSVYAPKNLTGRPQSTREVRLSTVWTKGYAWAKNSDDGFLYATPDMDLVTAWLNENYPEKNEVLLDLESAAWAHEEALPISFVAERQMPSSLEVAKTWAQIGKSS